jgi:hypothetical protein
LFIECFVEFGVSWDQGQFRSVVFVQDSSRCDLPHCLFDDQLNFVVVPELAVGIVVVVVPEVAEIVVDFVAEVAEDCFEMVGFVKIANFLETVLGSIC